MKKSLISICVFAFLFVSSYGLGVQQTSAQETPATILSKLQSALSELDTLKLTILNLQKQYLESMGTTAGSSVAIPSTLPASFTFKNELGLGETNEDIKKLQEFLAKDKGVYADGRVTGYFGPLTAEAVLKFQKKHGITGANGHVGPQTLAKLNQLIKASMPVVTPTIPQTPVTSTPNTTSTGKDYICHNNVTLLVSPSVANDYLEDYPKDYRGKCSTTGSNTTTSTQTTGTIQEIVADVKNRTTSVTVDYVSGKDSSFILDLFNKGDVIEELSNRLKISEDKIKDLLTFQDKTKIKEIVVIVGKNEAKVYVKYTNADPTLYTLDTDDEDDIVEELADKLRMDEDDVEDLIDYEEDKGDIEEITAKLGDNTVNILVEYEDGDHESFNLNTDDKEDIIEELADRLNSTEEVIEKIIRFKGETEISEIKVEIDDDEAYVTIDYKGKKDETFTLEEDDEDDIIEELADRLDMDEEEIEDLIEFED